MFLDDLDGRVPRDGSIGQKLLDCCLLDLAIVSQDAKGSIWTHCGVLEELTESGYDRFLFLHQDHDLRFNSKRFIFEKSPRRGRNDLSVLLGENCLGPHKTVGLLHVDGFF